MYQKRYREWDLSKCTFTNSNKQKVRITPKTLKASIKDVDHLIEISNGLLIASIVASFLLMVEICLISMALKEKIDVRILNLSMFARRCLSCILVVLWSYVCYLIYNFDGGK